MWYFAFSRERPPRNIVLKVASIFTGFVRAIPVGTDNHKSQALEDMPEGRRAQHPVSLVILAFRKSLLKRRSGRWAAHQSLWPRGDNRELDRQSGLEGGSRMRQTDHRYW